MSNQENRVRRVLVLRLSAMGDVAMTAPIIESACRANPDVVFDVLSASFHEPFFQSLPNLHFIGTDIKKQKGGVVTLWHLFKSLEVNDYDVVLDLHDVLRTKILRWLFRIDGVAVFCQDKGRAEKKALVRGECRKQLKPVLERYADVFRQANIALSDEKVLRPVEAIPAEAPVASKGSERWIGISPFAQHAGKMYPLERMARVVTILAAVPGVRIFVFGGGAAEKAKAEDLLKAASAPTDKVHNVIGTMKLRQEMALMSNLDVMLSMDSSAMHVSSLYGVRVVSIWGGTHPFAGFLGYGQRQVDVVQRDDLDCRPCSIFGNKPCRFGDYRCFDIAPEVVAQRVLDVV